MLGWCRMISAYRRNKNLKDYLVHTSFNPKPKKEALQAADINFINLPFLFNSHSRAGVRLWQALKPTTSNTIYVIRCRACHKLYIGETKNSIILRIKQHKYIMERGNGTTVLYSHFKLHGPQNIQSLGLESNREWSTARRESGYIY